MSDAAAPVRVLDDFLWVLRREGLPVSTAQAIHVVRAVEVIGLERMTDVRAAVAAVVIQRRQDRQRFDETFDVFFGVGHVLARRLTLWQRVCTQSSSVGG
ncbi:MAG: hypothetical protein M3O36_12560 [Myxococcota bacterium]|nr:hypothetical protein [Myxococcota bacterium]